jgi:hypothetical protein
MVNQSPNQKLIARLNRLSSQLINHLNSQLVSQLIRQLLGQLIKQLGSAYQAVDWSANQSAYQLAHKIASSVFTISAAYFYLIHSVETFLFHLFCQLIYISFIHSVPDTYEVFLFLAQSLLALSITFQQMQCV